MRRIPHSRPLLGRSEKEAVCRVITSGHLAQGAEVEALEKAVASVMGRRFAAAVHSGTAALHLSLMVLGVRRGDWVAIPSYVCSALLHAVSLVGARPLIVDVDPETFNMDPDDLRRRLKSATKAIIVPHMFGLPAEIHEIGALGVPIIEDCAISLGARHRDKPVGSFGMLSVVSFYATKMMTTGEGGMVVGDSASLLHKIRESRDYDGRSRHQARFNYKMTDLQAALGRVQLRRLRSFVRARRSLAQRYLQELAEGPWDLPESERFHVYYRFVIRPHRNAGRLLSQLMKQGVEARRPVFKPLHRYLGLEGFPGTDESYRRAVSIPLYPALTKAEIEYVIKSTKRAGKSLNGVDR